MINVWKLDRRKLDWMQHIACYKLGFMAASANVERVVHAKEMLMPTVAPGIINYASQTSATSH
jgi:hypothetical protein